MLQGNINKVSTHPTPAGDVAQAVDALQRTIYAVHDQAGRLAEGLQPVLRALPPEEEAKLVGVLSFNTPLACTLQGLNEQLEKSMKLLNDLSARLSI